MRASRRGDTRVGEHVSFGVERSRSRLTLDSAEDDQNGQARRLITWTPFLP